MNIDALKRKKYQKAEQSTVLSFRVSPTDLTSVNVITEDLDASRSSILREIFSRGIESLSNELTDKGLLTE